MESNNIFIQSWAEISFDALRDNLNLLKNQIGKKVKIAAVVKADAYGHGAVEISKYILKLGIDLLAVASIDEGTELRNSGIDAPILLLRNFSLDQIELVLKKELIPTVNTIELARQLSYMGSILKKKIKIHIKLDIGGNEGVSTEDIKEYFYGLSDLEFIEVEGVYTHLYSAYGSDVQRLEKQISMFASVLVYIKSEGFNIPLTHAANSPAIFRSEKSHFDMVRPGTALYGIPFPSSKENYDYKPIMQLKARISFIRTIEKGNCSGYGYTYVNSYPIKLATVPIGYADAFFLLHINNGVVLVKGKRVPMYGKAFMDFFYVDVTHLEDVRVGDEVVLFGEQKGEHLSISEVVSKSNIKLFNSESICFLGKRIRRVYVEEGNVVHVAGGNI